MRCKRSAECLETRWVRSRVTLGGEGGILYFSGKASRSTDQEATRAKAMGKELLVDESEPGIVVDDQSVKLGVAFDVASP